MKRCIGWRGDIGRKRNMQGNKGGENMERRMFWEERIVVRICWRNNIRAEIILEKEIA